MTTKQKTKILKIVSKFNERNIPHGTGADIEFGRRSDVTVYVLDGKDIRRSFSSYDFDTTDEFVDAVKFSLK